MRRVILSRKGMDSKAGGSASPILSDGRIFSLPIPQDHRSPIKYKDLRFDELSGSDLLKEVSSPVLPNTYCHLDPLLNGEIGVFGQGSSSQTELDNNGVGPGDLFLFFGWFKNFSCRGNDLHHLFGWLQIDQVIKGSENIKSFLRKRNLEHPHGYGDVSRYTNNTIYVGKNILEHKGDTPLEGSGVFKKTHSDLVLTEENKTRSRWKLPYEYFSDMNKLFLNRLKWENEESCRIFYKGFGQEFILDAEENPKIAEWALSLISKHGQGSQP